jgi:hypothetical protein
MPATVRRMGEITKYPLSWPDNVARTPPHQRERARFENWSIASATDFVLQEINRLNGNWHGYEDGSVIISSNLRYKRDGMPYSDQGEPADPGIAVYFNLQFERGGKTHERPIVLSCDKWTRVAWNLYAVGKDIEAQRGRHRWGCTNVEQAFRGYMAIPERTGGQSWWEVLGVLSSASEFEVREAFRAKALTEHPDKGGTQERWLRLQEALEQALSRVAR